MRVLAFCAKNKNFLPRLLAMPAFLCLALFFAARPIGAAKVLIYI